MADANVTIIYSDGHKETKKMSRDEAAQLQMQMNNGQLPRNIQKIEAENLSDPR